MPLAAVGQHALERAAELVRAVRAVRLAVAEPLARDARAVGAAVAVDAGRDDALEVAAQLVRAVGALVLRVALVAARDARLVVALEAVGAGGAYSLSCGAGAGTSGRGACNVTFSVAPPTVLGLWLAPATTTASG